MARGHDQPNLALIIDGRRQHQPSKRIQGEDYPVSALEELQKRDRGSAYSRSIFFKNTKILFEGVTKAPGVSSKNISNKLLDTNEKEKPYLRDAAKPVGDACRDDGTLKDANEIDWLNSPSELEPRNDFHTSDGYDLMDSMYVSESEEGNLVNLILAFDFISYSHSIQQRSLVGDIESENERIISQKHKKVA